MRRLAVASLRMFLQCAAGCCTGNFLVLYLEHRGLDQKEIGIIVGLVSPVATMLGAPLWTWLSDCFRMPMATMVLSLVLGSAGYAAVMFVPSAFPWIAAVAGGATFLRAAVDPMLDSAVTSALALQKVPLNHYGRYRLFGGVGWGVAAGGLGPLLDRFGLPFLFYAYGVLVVLFLLSIVAFEFRTDGVHAPTDFADTRTNSQAAGEPAGSAMPPETKDIASESSPLLASDTDPARNKSESGGFWGLLLGGDGVLLFMGYVVAMGAAKGVIDAFLFLWLKELGASNTLSGLTLVVTVVGEVPFFFFSGDIIDRITPTGAVLVAMVAYAGRLYYYSCLLHGHAILVLPAELLHGVTWALSWVAVVTEAKRAAPAGYASAAQGVFQALFWGVGFGVGAVTGGYWYAAHGARSLFLWASVLIGGICALGIFAEAFKFACCRPVAHGCSAKLKPEFSIQ